MHYRCPFLFVSLLLLGLYASPTPLSAQEVTFTHLTTDDGLPSNLIMAILQDHRGYLWFGTRGGGLVRYDGYEMKVYRHVAGDSTSLSGGEVRALHETDDGTLWVGTDDGLSRFDAASETFKVYQHIPGDSTSLSPGPVRALYEADDGTLWVGTRGGLNRFDAASETFAAYRHVPGDSTSLSRGRVLALHQTDDGTLWVGAGGGLNRFDAATETFKVYQHIPGDSTSLSPGPVRALYEADDGTLWVATRRGLSRFDAASGTFETYRHVPGDPTSLSPGRGRALQQTDDGTLWVATTDGLSRFDAATETFETYQHVPGDPTSLSHDELRALHKTDDGTLWVGTVGGGVSRFDAASGTFEVYRHEPGDSTSLSRGRALALHETDDGTLWVGTLGGGLNRFDAATETFEAYRHREGDSTSLSPGEARALHEADDSTLWVGTWGGLSRFDAVSGTLKVYRHEPGDSTSLSPGPVQALHQTDDGTLWVGTGGGLSRFVAATETFEVYRHEPGDSTSLSQGAIQAIHESGDGTLWVGTGEGLNRLDKDPADPTSVSFTRFLAGTGSSIRSILEDEQNQLWLGLFNGSLVRFNPETRQVRSFGKRYGLPAGSFNSGVLQSRTDRLYWGNAAGLISLRPGRLPPPDAPPRLELSELWLFDERLTPGPESPLKHPLWQTEALQLSHTQNDLTFGFVAIHYADPAENRYQYRLLGYDRAWRGETQQRRATYTNLPPGSYTFEVKASNSDGIWTEEAVRLDVEILPPWWRTVWAYMVYGLLLVGAVFAVDRVQRRRIVQRERERARERELEQAREIEKAHTELQASHQHLKATQAQLIQSEKMASLGQLTAGIAHEIKNPLNFVNNFAEVNEELARELKELISENRERRIAEVLEDLDDIASGVRLNSKHIVQHGKRADAIVQNMMEHATGGTGERYDVGVNKLVNEYVGLSFQAMQVQLPNLTVEIKRDYGEAVGTVEMAPQEMGRALLNLLNNAFEAVHQRAQAADGSYTPTVKVLTRKVDGQVEIRVCDNGGGIPMEIKDKIFEPFFTTKPTGSGTGLGLSLSYDIVTQGHGGTLTVESTEGEGATFVITLPMNSANTG